jgi:hypothetical protein
MFDDGLMSSPKVNEDAIKAGSRVSYRKPI